MWMNLLLLLLGAYNYRNKTDHENAGIYSAKQTRTSFAFTIGPDGRFCSLPLAVALCIPPESYWRASVIDTLGTEPFPFGYLTQWRV